MFALQFQAQEQRRSKDGRAGHVETGSNWPDGTGVGGVVLARGLSRFQYFCVEIKIRLGPALKRKYILGRLAATR